MTLIYCVMSGGPALAQVIDLETFGSGPYPGAQLPAGQTTYTYNPVTQPANFPNILTDGEYVLATDSQQGFVNWASIGDNTTGTGYMMLVNADDGQADEFYRRTVNLTANTTFDFLTYVANVNSQGDFDFCTNNQGGLILPNVKLQIEDINGNILADMDTGDIAFNPTPIWEEYQLVFSTGASTTQIDVVLINNSVGGCGNDLAIDDITFRVAVTMESQDDTVTVTGDTANQQNDVIFLGANDTLDGNPLPGTELYFVAAGSSLPSELLLDQNTGGISVAAGAANGTYSFTYQVCETANQFNCDEAVVTVIVDAPPAIIMAANDNGSVLDSSTGFTPVLNVLNNDDIDGVTPPSDFDLSVAPGATLPTGLTFDTATGDVGVLQGTPTGVYVFDYNLCEAGDPSNCETATVTIKVENLSPSSFCPIGTTLVNGTFNVLSASGAQNPNNAVGTPLAEGTVVTNNNQTGVTFFQTVTYDLTGDPNILVPEGDVIEIVLTRHFNSNARAEIFMSPDGTSYTSLGTTGSGGNVYGPWVANTLRYDDFAVPAGGARFIQIDHQQGGIRHDGVIYGAQCVPGPVAVVDAENDSGVVADSSLGFTPVLNVLDNDSIDGISPPAAFDLSIAVGSTLPSGLTFDTATGEVGVLQGTASGVYTFDYTLCEAGNASNCETVSVKIGVTNPNPPEVCPAGTTQTPGTFHVVSVSAAGAQNPNNAIGAPLPEGTTVTNNNQSGATFFQDVIYDLTGDPNIIVPEDEVIEVSLANHWGSNPTGNISFSLDGTSFTPAGSSTGSWVNNTFRYDDYAVPAGGARFLQIDYGGGGGLRFDGVIYGSQCLPGAAPPELSVSKTVTMVDQGQYAVPGNDVIYTISVANGGAGPVDNNTLELIDIMPGEITFYNGDIDDGGPEVDSVIFTDNGTGLSFDNINDVGFSNSVNGPPSNFNACNYIPNANSYDSAITYICFNPKGSMNAASDWNVRFRARIN